MAPTLTSNSFILRTPPRSRSRVSLKNPKFTILAEVPTGGGGAKKLGDVLQFLNLEKIADVRSLVPVVTSNPSALSFGNRRRKDPGTVYVSGATGQAGIRIAQTLLRQGFTVRAGVPELAAAQDLARLASQYKIISPQESRRLNAVQSTYEDAESIAKAIGNASKVVVTIGPTENGPAKEVTTSDALQVIRGAKLAGVGHVAIVYDGRSIFSGQSSTYNVLDGISSFFGSIFSPQSQPLAVAEFLQEVVQTDVAYTLIKTSLTDDFSPESSYNLVVSPEGVSGANDLKVAKSQIASVIADVLSNTAMAENKVVQVSTDPSAPLKSIDELLGAIPEDGRRKAYAEALAKAKAEEEAILASEKAREAAEAAKKLQDEVQKLSQQEAAAANLAKEAQQKAAVAGTSVDTLLEKAKNIGTGLSWQKLSSQLASAVQKQPDEDEIEQKPKVQIATIRGQAKARTLPPQKAVLKPRTPKPPPPLKPMVEKTAEAKPEVRKVFGGLFQQETIYVDD